MKFEEKLMKLRKERALSQEELGEKLNVTRQTVSKWELGQSKPEMDKLIEISKFFGVSLEELTNDEGEVKSSEGTITKETNGNRKYIIIVLVIVGVLAIGLLLSKLLGGLFVFNKAYDVFDTVFNSTNQSEEQMQGFKNTFIDMIDTMENKIEEQDEKYEQEKKEKQQEWEQEKQKSLEEYKQSVEQMEQKYQEQYNQQVEQMEEKYQEFANQMGL